jgi:hypothetical protein
LFRWTVTDKAQTHCSGKGLDAEADALDRLTSVSQGGLSAASGGLARTTYAYPNTVTVQTFRDRDAFGDGVIQSENVYDGLGRISELRQFVDSTTCAAGGVSPVVVKTTYDALGRRYVSAM